MFCTEPARDNHPELAGQLADELSQLSVTQIPSGTYVVVPTNLDGPNVWPWIEHPEPVRGLPPLPAVLATARRNGNRLN
jgi:hypothetical protein